MLSGTGASTAVRLCGSGTSCREAWNVGRNWGCVWLAAGARQGTLLGVALDGTCAQGCSSLAAAVAWRSWLSSAFGTSCGAPVGC